MSSSLVGQRLGRYEIRSEIGRGGMGMVFQGFDTLLQRVVAVKVLPPQFAFDDDFVRRFHREAVMSAQLHHSNVVTIHDVGEHDGYHYIVMEFLEGQTLDQWLKDNGTMPLPQAVQVLRQVASALDFAHSRGMIHRDIKPSNIMLASDGHATLMDFGLVRAAEGAMLTRTGMVVGTPEYMAPEQATGAEIDGRTDVYALGVVLYRMLSGHLPFTRSTPYAVTYAHIHEAPPPLRQLRADLPARMEAILLKAMAKEPAARYARASQMANDFAAAVAEMPAAETIARPAADLYAAQTLIGDAPTRQVVNKPPSAAPPPRPVAAPAPASTPRRALPLPLIIGAVALLAILGIGGFALAGNRGAVSAPTATAAALAAASPTPAPATATLAAPPTVVTPTVVTPTAAATAAPASPTAAALATSAVTVTVTLAPTATAPPPDTPTATLTNTPAPTNTPAARPTATRPAATVAPAAPGVVLDFERDIVWRRGQQPYGTLTRAAEQVKEGKSAGKLAYDFAAVTDNYVVFEARPPLSIPGRPTGLTAWVYGDGAGHFLNVWLQDKAGEVRSYTFGQIKHQGWQQLTAWLNDQAPWPVGHISGANNQKLDYPVSFFALVLDGVPDGQASRGVIYVDDLRATDAPLPALTVTPDAGAPTPAQPGATATPNAGGSPSNLSGRIAYTVWNNGHMDTVVYNVSNDSRTPIIANMRQPDFNLNGELVGNGDGGGADNLVRTDRNGGNKRALSEHSEDAHPHWSPSGISIIFDSTAQGDGRSRLYFQEDAGARSETPPLKIGSQEVFGRYPVILGSWRVAFNGCNNWDGGRTCGIMTIDTNGNNPGVATDQAGDIPTDNLGSQVLFMSNRDGNWEVYRVGGDGSGLQRLTNNPANDGLATASPDGNFIAFVSNRDGNWAVFVMRADGREPRKLFDLNGGYGSGDWDWTQERLSWGP